MTRNLKEPKEVFSFGLFICCNVSLSFLLSLSNFCSWQVEIEQKKSLKLDFDGDEMENPKECGVQ